MAVRTSQRTRIPSRKVTEGCSQAVGSQAVGVALDNGDDQDLCADEDRTELSSECE